MIKTNKKLSMKLSLYLIIMLIIGLIVGSLVIISVQKKTIDDTEEFPYYLSMQDEIKIEEVLGLDGNFLVIPQPELVIKQGKKAKLYMKIRNTGSDDFIVNPWKIKNTGTTEKLLVNVENTTGDVFNDKFTFSTVGFDVAPGDVQARVIYIRTTANPGIYYVKFTAIGINPTIKRTTIIVE